MSKELDYITELENKIADIKANCDLAIEGRDIKIMELERLNSNQAESLRITMLEEEKKNKRITELEEENAELEEYKNGNFVQTVNQIIEGKDKRLEQAKKIIKGLLSCCRNYPQENAEKMKQAEQFLKGENIILEDAQVGNSPFDADEVFNKEMKAYPNRKVK